MGFSPAGTYIAMYPGGLVAGVPNRTPSKCPICGEPGGFHDRERHAQIQRTLARLRIAVRSPVQWGGMVEVRSAVLNDLDPFGEGVDDVPQDRR
jgi:hypothetical protein